jgi:hypothetical protein
MTAGRYVVNVFCDQADVVGHEAGPLLNLKGVHEGSFGVPKFPMQIAQLCALARIYSPAARPFSTLSVEYRVGTDVIVGKSYAKHDLKSIEGDPVSESAMLRISLLFRLENFTIPAPGKIWCHVEADGERIPAEPLSIVLLPASAATKKATGGVRKVPPRKRTAG